MNHCTSSPSTWKAEAEGLHVQGKAVLHSKTLPQKAKQNKRQGQKKKQKT
jgi:hypothetical protein